MTSQDKDRPFPPEPVVPSNQDVEEKAIQSNELLNNPVLQEAINDIYSRAAGMLLKSEVGSLTAQQQHAMMKATFDLRKQLEHYVDDAKVRQKYFKERKNA